MMHFFSQSITDRIIQTKNAINVIFEANCMCFIEIFKQ